MTKGVCTRCGIEESVFWYPYAFGVAPVPDARSGLLADCQRYMLCDKCQMDFIRFMHMNPSGYYIKKEESE